MNKPPILPTQIITVSIESIGEKGDGVAIVNKFILFIKGGELGKSYIVQVQKVFKSYAFAKILTEAKTH